MRKRILKYMNLNNRKRNNAKGLIIGLFVLLGILLLIFICLGIIYVQLGKLSYESKSSDAINIELETPVPTEDFIPEDAPTFVPPTKDSEAEPTPTPLPELSQDITNILVLGCDTREQNVFINSRSDVNIILTIDKKNNKVKITSLLRDILVYYPDIKDYQRLNFALAYFDDPQKVAETIENNFGLNIDYYMITDFWGMAELIDILGGVNVNLTEAEIEVLNIYVLGHNKLCNYENLQQDIYTGQAGDVTINGRQAVAYMRNRKIGADYERVKRQYEVLHALKHELSDMSFLEINKIITKLPDILSTDMTQIEIIKTASTLFKMRDCEMEHARVPFDNTFQSSTYKKMWILDIDFDENRELLNEFIYE